MPPSPLDTPPLVGRDRELATLRRQLDAAIAGRGGLVLIGGEAGIGKTALAEALCREAADGGASMLIGRCFDLAETPPYGPWVDLFARYRPDGDDPPPPEPFARRGTVGAVTSQAALLEQVLDFLAPLSARRAVVLLLDDLHWADPASLDLLRVVARTAPALSLLILATYRTDEVTRRHPLYPLLPQVIREAHAERVDLRPLDDDALHRLIQGRYHLPEGDARRLVGYLRGRAEGNALFTGELLRSLAESGTLRREGEAWLLADLRHTALPTLLRQVIDRRVARLDAASRRVLALAAVVGQEAPLAALGSLAGTDDSALLAAVEAACEAHLLIETPDGLRVSFAHALIREALYEGISPARRRLTHRQIAEWLAARPQPDPDAVATHFQRASDRRAVVWLVRAGERAQLAYAWLTAVGRYEAALGSLEADNGDLGEQGWLRYRIARVRRAFAPRQAIAHLDAALRIADATGDRALGAAARYSRGLCRLYESDDYSDTDIMAEMVAGCDALEALPPDEQERLGLGPDEQGLPAITNMRGFLVAVLAGSGRVAEALALGEATRDGKPRRTPLADMAWENYGDREAGLGTAYALAGRPAEARAACERAGARFRAVGNYGSGNTMAMELLTVWLPYFADRTDDLRRLADESEEANRRLDSAFYDRLAHLPLLALAGRWGEAREGAEAALQREWGQRVFRGVAIVVLSDLNRAQGETDAAWAYIRALLPSGPETSAGSLLWFIGPPLLRGAAAIAMDEGDLHTSRTWLEAHDRWLAWSGAVLGQSEGQCLWAQFHRQAGDMDAARDHGVRALAHATAPRQPLALLAAHRLLGELDTETGCLPEAAAHLAVSLALSDACRAPYERALTLIARARLHVTSGSAMEAATALAQARVICTALGALPALARIDALDASLPASVAGPASPAGMTGREVEVLRHIAAGESNREIAAALSVSVRTVERHIENLYRKIGTRSKADATAYAFRHRLA